MPIRRAGGEFFGTLCAIDPRPAKLKKPEVIGMFTLFADLIGFHLDAQERLATSEATLERLFQPFTRASAQPHQQGLGLGLYIAAEIARAHGGALDVTSSPSETRFTLRMPAHG